MRLFQNIEKFKNETALINDAGKKFTYKKISSYSKKISKIIKPRSLVLLITENSIGSVISYISLIKNDCVVIIIDVKTPANSALELFKKYKPNFILFPQNWTNFQKFNNCSFLISFLDYDIICNNIQNKFKIHPELSMLLTTSGSMGSSKLVKLSQKNLFVKVNYIFYD